MRIDRAHRIIRFVHRPLIALIAGLMFLVTGIAATGHADPAEDALAKLQELSRQAEQTTEAMHSARLDLEEKLAAQRAAEEKLAADTAAAEAATARLANYQVAVDKLAASQYMGARTDGFNAMLTAGSPQQLIDQLAVQRVMATEMSARMDHFRTAGQQATQAAEASAKSAAEAKTAAEQAAAVRAELQAKQSELQLQIEVVKAQYEALTPDQQEALAAMPPVPPGTPTAELPPAEDTAVLAAPGIHPGDIAPEAAIPGGAPGRGTVVQAALSRIGSPYSWGGSGPNAFDCSGLVMWAFQQGAGVNLPHSSQALARGGQPVSMADMQPGDVVTYYSDASHAGIYIGNGMMVHASTYGTPVRVAPVNNAPIYNIRRY
ncbi:peptidoglycan hydrolase RipC [Mycolicibacterium thermoresistibile]